MVLWLLFVTNTQGTGSIVCGRIAFESYRPLTFFVAIARRHSVRLLSLCVPFASTDSVAGLLTAKPLRTDLKFEIRPKYKKRRSHRILVSLLYPGDTRRFCVGNTLLTTFVWSLLPSPLLFNAQSQCVQLNSLTVSTSLCNHV